MAGISPSHFQNLIEPKTYVCPRTLRLVQRIFGYGHGTLGALHLVECPPKYSKRLIHEETGGFCAKSYYYL